MGCDEKGPGYGKPVVPYPELYRMEALELEKAMRDGSFDPVMSPRDLFGYFLLPLLRRVESLEKQLKVQSKKAQQHQPSDPKAPARHEAGCKGEPCICSRRAWRKK